jgi:hypothetical protein
MKYIQKFNNVIEVFKEVYVNRSLYLVILFYEIYCNFPTILISHSISLQILDSTVNKGDLLLVSKVTLAM